MTNNDKSSIHASVLSAITNGTVRMRPHWHFVVRSLGLALGVLCLGVLGIFLISFIVFALHQSGVWFVPPFGMLGIGVLLRSFPWLLVVIALVAVVVLEALVRRYAFAYRKPILYSSLGIILVVLLGGFALAQTPVHRLMFQRAQTHALPIAGPLYRDYGTRRPNNMVSGVVRDVSSDGYVVEVAEGELIVVATTSETRSWGRMMFAPGDEIVVLGSAQRGVLRARGIRKIVPGARIMHGPPGAPMRW